MALGAIVAGTVADRVVHAGASLIAYTHNLVALVVCVILLFSGPLLVFTGKRFYTKWRGTCEYGALANGAGGQFEHRWLRRPESLDESALAVLDFSGTADLYHIVANVYDMGIIPLDLRNILLLRLGRFCDLRTRLSKEAYAGINVSKIASQERPCANSWATNCSSPCRTSRVIARHLWPKVGSPLANANLSVSAPEAGARWTNDCATQLKRKWRWTASSLRT